jgi:hypothetical protein
MLSRRSFFGGALALSAVIALPLEAFPFAPTIYADGVHDDTAGLQALLDGKPFRVAGEARAWRSTGKIFLGTGTYLLSDTLHFRDVKLIDGCGATFDGRRIPSDRDAIIHIHGSSESSPATLRDMRLMVADTRWAVIVSS